MSKPTLSVIMPCYNHAHYIGEALEAILSQFFLPSEVVVIDDGSSDNSIEVVRQFTKNNSIIRLLCNKHNMGVNYNVNKGLEVSIGDYVCFHSADDRLLPGFFEKSINLLMRYPQAALCCSDPAHFYDSGVFIKNSLHLTEGPFYFSPDKLVDYMHKKTFPIASHTSIVKRTSVIEAGGMMSELKWHCDWLALLVIAFRYGLCYIPESLAALRISPNSYSKIGMERWPEQKQVLNNLISLLKSPAYLDVYPLFKRSAIVPTFNLKTLCLMLTNPKWWSYLSPLLIWRMLRHGIRGFLARIAPSRAKRFYRLFRGIERKDISAPKMEVTK